MTFLQLGATTGILVISGYIDHVHNLSSRVETTVILCSSRRPIGCMRSIYRSFNPLAHIARIVAIISKLKRNRLVLTTLAINLFFCSNQ